jgi:aminoglycoside phosphotransferase (APT) family kinase protein
MDDRLVVSPETVATLVVAQFPAWAALPVKPIIPGGWCNRSFRLGETMVVRLPSAERYVAQVEKERAVLARLAGRMPVAIPETLGVGAPGAGYPFPWSVRRWIEGAVVDAAQPDALGGLAGDVAVFLHALWALDTTGGPGPGAHNFHRGGDLSVYGSEVEASLAALGAAVDAAGARAVWAAALAASWQGEPVWVHGDVAPGNLLQRDGQLVAAIDWGSAAVGDPACDLVMAWTVLEGPSRHRFRAAVGSDSALWVRARGWALWKALLVLAGRSARQPLERAPEAVAADIISEHRRYG